MKKRIIMLLMSVVTVFMFAGCGQPEVTEEVDQPESLEPVYVYSYSADYRDELKYIEEKYPDLYGRIEYIIPETEDYSEYMRVLLADKNAEKYPDIVVGDMSFAKELTESEYIENISALGILQQDCDQMYEFTKDMVTDKEGNIKGLSGSIVPGAFIYRKALAKEYLGSDEADEVQSYVRDWVTFADTARAIYLKSDGKTRMLAAADEMDTVFASNREKANSVSEEPDIFADVRDILNNEGYAGKAATGSTEYIKAASGNAVFGYFVPVDFITGGMTVNVNGMLASLGYKGDWGVCQGPEAFICDGAWTFVTKECAEKEQLGNALKYLYGDMSLLEKRRNDTKAFVNNIKVMENAFNSGKGKADALGGWDYIEVFNSQVKKYGE